jgi:hypothetical protein
MNKITINPEIYKRTGWIPTIAHLEMDNYQPRLVIRVATGRKYWPIFTGVINPELGLIDPAISNINDCLQFYTHPMGDRFKSELEVLLSDVYSQPVELIRPTNWIKK